MDKNKQMEQNQTIEKTDSERLIYNCDEDVLPSKKYAKYCEAFLTVLNEFQTK